MKHPDMKQPKSKKPGGSSRGASGPEAFDLWLKRGLHQIYDDVAKEPIPKDILRLLEEDGAKVPEGDKKK